MFFRVYNQQTMIFQAYKPELYQTVCDFLLSLNRLDKIHINWNWARFEWSMGHPYFQKESENKIGLWYENGRVVALAVYDTYPGEAACLVASGYEPLFEEVLSYAYANLKDDQGLGVAINDKSEGEIEIAKRLGFSLAEQKETLMVTSAKGKEPALPMGYRFVEPDNPDEVQWVIYQGFDHGNDFEAFLRQKTPVADKPHLNPYLHLCVETEAGEKVAYCCLWYDPSSDYAYLEPLCVIPGYRGKGLGKALVYELLRRANSLGADSAYVISDMDFYKKLGFKPAEAYSFYWKK